MMCVHFVGNYAYASNSSVLIKQSLDYHSIINKEFLDGRCLHRDSYEEIMDYDECTCDDAGIRCKSKDGRIAFIEYFDLKGQPTPNFDAVIADGGFNHLDSICINAKMVKILNDAMYSPNDHLLMQFKAMGKPILVTAPGIEDQVAILMPLDIQTVMDFK